MQYLFFMAVADTFEKLIREALDDHGVHAFFFAEVVHVFLEIVLEILKDEDKFFIGGGQRAEGGVGQKET